jgi:hypothetical protein
MREAQLSKYHQILLETHSVSQNGFADVLCQAQLSYKSVSRLLTLP